jgi:ABC-type bacteriocin/lantibiotic exporter with double-glycine peptidase domain
VLPGGLDGRIGERGKLLSGGQRQRVALARALYRQAELLVLDEATSSLDAEAEAAFIKALEGLRGRMTVIAISHRQPVLDHCDRVVRLDGGRIVGDTVKEARSLVP